MPPLYGATYKFSPQGIRLSREKPVSPVLIKLVLYYLGYFMMSCHWQPSIKSATWLNIRLRKIVCLERGTAAPKPVNVVEEERILWLRNTENCPSFSFFFPFIDKNIFISMMSSYVEFIKTASNFTLLVVSFNILSFQSRHERFSGTSKSFGGCQCHKWYR